MQSNPRAVRACLAAAVLLLGCASEFAAYAVPAPIPSCSSSSGPLTLKATSTRASGISPFLVFFDATGTTDGSLAAGTGAFEGVSYTWEFGDDGASGSDTWAQGANPGHASRNTATGGVAAHLYVRASGDAQYTATVTARDGTNTASCRLSVTAFDPSGPHGFPRSKTVCVSSSAKPVGGKEGCPVGASVLRTPIFNLALDATHFGDRRRVLFRCGDTFIGDSAVLNATTWSIGAYGGCEGTRTNRPILRDNGSTGHLVVAATSGDGRIADLNLEGGDTAGTAINSLPCCTHVPYQITLFNLLSNGNSASFIWSQGAQWGLVDSAMKGMRDTGTFMNYNENNPRTWSGNPYDNLDYQALLGNDLNGAGVRIGGAGRETVRISACRLCAIESNTIQNADTVGAILKLHNGNTNGSLANWTGVYTEFVEISDNWLGGASGGQIVELAPQNDETDERLRDIVFERNLVSGSTGAQGGRQMLVSAVNVTVRNNVFYMPGTPKRYPIFAIQAGLRGVEPATRGVEIFHNTCYAPNAIEFQTCVAFDGLGLKGPARDSRAANNLFVVPAPNHVAVTDKGLANRVAANLVVREGDAAFAGSRGGFRTLADFKPSELHGGGAGVPVLFDAAGAPRKSTLEIGAIQQ